MLIGSGERGMERGNTRRVIAAGAIGNVLEWYDFAVYGYFAAAIGRAFFPSEDPVAQVLAAFGIGSTVLALFAIRRTRRAGAIGLLPAIAS